MNQGMLFKYLAGGLTAFLFLAVAVRLIQWEGERARQALRNAPAEVREEIPIRIAHGAAPLPGDPARTNNVRGQDLPAAKPAPAVKPAPAEGIDQPAPDIKPLPVEEMRPKPAPAAVIAPTPPTEVPKSPLPAPPADEQRPVAAMLPLPDIPAPPPKLVPPQADPPVLRPLLDRPLLAADGPMSPGQTIGAPLRLVYPSRRDESMTIYHHASTLEEGYMRGMADLVRSQGQANLDHSAAAINYSLARQNEIQNRARWTQAYFEMRRMNRAYREQERGPPPSMQDLVRFAQAGKPARLRPHELDCVSGRIQWPLLLRAEQFASGRAVLEELFAQRTQQGGIGVENYLEIRRTTDQMKAALKDQLQEVPPSQYVIAKRFLESLAYETDLPAS